MFRFAELLIIIFMLYLIVNILRYTIVNLGNLDRIGGGSWLFGLSSGWLESAEKKRQNETREKKDLGPGGER